MTDSITSFPNLSAIELENCTSAQRFSLNVATGLISTWVNSNPTLNSISEDIKERIGVTGLSRVLSSLTRNVFFIEATNSAVSSTKYTYRWMQKRTDYFDFHVDDPRGNSFAECVRLFESLMVKLRDDLRDPKRLEIIVSFLEYNLVSYELPLDYIKTNVDNLDCRYHSAENIDWVWSDESAKTIHFRKDMRLLSRKVHEYEGLEHLKGVVIFDNTLAHILNRILCDKIEIKTYKTDRAQTGIYQTNREKRWEAHPKSVQYACRKDAWRIEHRLLEQLVHFRGFPESARLILSSNGVITPGGTETLCPITQEPLSFEEIAREVLAPSHGRSRYQVGHLNPLKAVGRENPDAGHTFRNIAWISQDGNRIQGSLSLDETRAMLERIWRNYKLD
jgi:hypothetical protein